ncbi:MAG: DinB family protein [Acidobacteria bacterium]|nr:DinB family protein [Acidobacteriota bacterium]
MIRRMALYLALLAGVWLGCAQHTMAQQSAPEGGFLGPIKAQWERVADMVVGIADIIPEDKYDYKPTPEVRSFREQLQHLVFENYNFMAAVAGDPAPDRAKSEALKTKAELMQALKDSYAYGQKVWAGLDEKKALEPITFRNTPTLRWVPALSNITDNMDHYGNLVVYVRVNGLVPPRITPGRRFASG